jgi:hypothetical protein
MQPADRQMHYGTCGHKFRHVLTTKIQQYFRKLGMPLIVICPREAREPARNNRCGPVLYKGCSPTLSEDWELLNSNAHWDVGYVDRKVLSLLLERLEPTMWYVIYRY